MYPDGRAAEELIAGDRRIYDQKGRKVFRGDEVCRPKRCGF